MQRYRAVILLVVFGVLPVAAAFFVALEFLDAPEPEQVVEAPPPETAPDPPPEPGPPETVEVLAAARALPIGTLLGKYEQVKVLELDANAYDDDRHFEVDDDPKAVKEAVAPLRGYALREALAEGAPLERAAMVGPNQRGFLAAVLRPGSRAVTVRVGPATSHAGLIDPGDRVDVVLSAELAIDEGGRSVHARTIVEDVRVVAVDERPGGAAEPASGDGGEVERTQIVTATLETTPEQGDRLILGESEGSLSLAVRSLVAGAPRNEGSASAVDLRELLLTPAEHSESERRLRQAQEVSDLALRTLLVESKDQLRAAVEKSAPASIPEVVRIYRGSEPAEEVAFARD